MSNEDSISWTEAVDDFLSHVSGLRAPKTERFYRIQLRQLVHWCEDKHVCLGDFRARNMRAYLAYRAEQKVKDSTRRHDFIAARKFFAFCRQEGYVQSNPLLGCEVPKAAKPYIKKPSLEEIRTLLTAVIDRWKPGVNPKARYVPPSERRFLSVRDYAILSGLVDTGCRIGEMLALTLADYQPDQRQIVIRESKGDEPRTIPISLDWTDAVRAWLKVRPQVPCDRLFITEFGEPLHPDVMSKKFQTYLKFAGLSGFSLHGLRHYALTELAKTDLWAAAQIAGHKDLKVTRAYLHGDPDHVREAHATAQPLAKVFVRRQTAPTRRRKVI